MPLQQSLLTGLAELAKLLGKPFADMKAALKWAHRMSWAADPFALGGYASLRVGAMPSSRAGLAEPLRRLLYFAGEACSQAHPQTVHGAMETGMAAADAIVEEVEDEGLDLHAGAALVAGAARACFALGGIGCCCCRH